MSHMSVPDHQKPKQDHPLPQLSSPNPTPTTTTPTTAPATEPEPEKADEEEDAEHILTALLETDDDDPTAYPAHLRDSRAQALASELQHARRYHAAASNREEEPLLTALTSDESVLKFTTRHPTCLVHFSHPDFARCGVMDRHLTRLVPRHAEETRFGSVDVRVAPFVVERLGVRVLPCVVGFREGVAVGRIVGFEGVFLGGGGGRGGQGQGEGEGGVDVTRAIERVVVGWGVFEARTKGWVAIGGSGSEGEDEDEEVEEQRTRRMNGGGLFGSGRRGIKDSKKGIADDDDDDWD